MLLIHLQDNMCYMSEENECRERGRIWKTDIWFTTAFAHLEKEIVQIIKYDLVLLYQSANVNYSAHHLFIFWRGVVNKQQPKFPDV